MLGMARLCYKTSLKCKKKKNNTNMMKIKPISKIYTSILYIKNVYICTIMQ